MPRRKAAGARVKQGAKPRSPAMVLRLAHDALNLARGTESESAAVEDAQAVLRALARSFTDSHAAALRSKLAKLVRKEAAAARSAAASEVGSMAIDSQPPVGAIAIDSQHAEVAASRLRVESPFSDSAAATLVRHALALLMSGGSRLARTVVEAVMRDGFEQLADRVGAKLAKADALDSERVVVIAAREAGYRRADNLFSKHAYRTPKPKRRRAV